MFQYALFDLDGTLTDPKEGICKSVQFALHMQGIEEPDIDKLTPFIGPPLKGSFMDFYHMTEEQAMTAIGDYRKRFIPMGMYENKVYPGIPEMLRALKDAGMVLGIASSKPEPLVIKILEHFDLIKYFDVVTGASMDQSRTEKEAVVEEALRRLSGTGSTDLNEKNCAMVGDRKFDVEGARAHHLAAVCVSYGYAVDDELAEAGADYIASDVQKLRDYLLTGKSEAKKKQADEAISPFRKTGHILLPLIVYYVGYNVFYMLLVIVMDKILQTDLAFADTLRENSSSALNIIQSASMLAGSLFLLPRFLQEKIPTRAQKLPNVIAAVIWAVSLSIGLNVLFDLFKLAASDSGYREVAESQYSVSLTLGLILYGVISPITEEILFRGLIYGRMRKFFSLPVSMVVSSFLFGAYHGNILQGLYGFLLGLMIVYLYEKTQHFAMPVMAHALANMSVFMLTYDGSVIKKEQEPLIFAICSVIALAAYLFIRYKGKENVR
ncbi:MAG: HAD hydrolase-like protein [Lachnospiraceae bacterium]|nr:HAD hydrolase-like protein [Lachnospiraceae bacterium]